MSPLAKAVGLGAALLAGTAAQAQSPGQSPGTQAGVAVYAAGSLKAALNEVAQAFARNALCVLATPGFALQGKTLQLTGGPNSPKPPADRSVHGELVFSGQADAFVTYCNNAAVARRERPRLQVLQVPKAINVSTRYGLALLEPATLEARVFVQYLLGPQGQAMLASHGFSAP